nr:unnamed protein product [Digitaria exilis]
MATIAGGGGTVKQLNVGGKLFSLEASSLSLSSLSLDSPLPTPTFVDRDPALLSAVLAAIRAPSSAAPAFPARVLLDEAHFYGLHAQLLAALSPPPLRGFSVFLASTLSPASEPFPTALAPHHDGSLCLAHGAGQFLMPGKALSIDSLPAAHPTSAQHSAVEKLPLQASSVAKSLFKPLQPQLHSSPCTPQQSHDMPYQDQPAAYPTQRQPLPVDAKAHTQQDIASSQCSIVSSKTLIVSPLKGGAYYAAVERSYHVSSPLKSATHKSTKREHVKGKLNFDTTDSRPGPNDQQIGDKASTSSDEDKQDDFDIDFTNLDIFDGEFSFSELLLDLDLDTEGVLCQNPSTGTEGQRLEPVAHTTADPGLPESVKPMAADSTEDFSSQGATSVTSVRAITKRIKIVSPGVEVQRVVLGAQDGRHHLRSTLAVRQRVPGAGGVAVHQSVCLPDPAGKPLLDAAVPVNGHAVDLGASNFCLFDHAASTIAHCFPSCAATPVRPPAHCPAASPTPQGRRPASLPPRACNPPPPAPNLAAPSPIARKPDIRYGTATPAPCPSRLRRRCPHAPVAPYVRGSNNAVVRASNDITSGSSTMTPSCQDKRSASAPRSCSPCRRTSSTEPHDRFTAANVFDVWLKLAEPMLPRPKCSTYCPYRHDATTNMNNSSWPGDCKDEDGAV